MGAPLLERLESRWRGASLAHVPMGEEDTGKEVEGERKRTEGKTRKQRGGRNSRKERRRDSWGFTSSAFSGQLSAPALGAALSSFCLMAGPVHFQTQASFQSLEYSAWQVFLHA